ERGRLTLRQEGRPEMAVGGIQLRLRAENSRLELEGKASDDVWGDWTVHGQVDPETRAWSASLKAKQVHVTQAMLDAVPFVPEVTWQEVRVEEGDAGAEITFRQEAGEERVHYRVDLSATGGTVYVAAAEVTAEQSRGRVLVEDGRVQILKGQGRVAD